MAEPLKILGIAGSLRRDSYNKAALRAAQLLAPAGVVLEPFDLEGIPLYNQDNELSPPPQVVELKRRVRSADAILFVTPEHNFSIPAALKNAIDWVSRPQTDNAWAGKPAAVMGASYGRIATARAQAHLRQIFVYIDVLPINKPVVMIGEAAQAFDSQGTLVDEKAKNLIRQLLEALATWVLRLRGPGTTNA
ncbi:MAG TPA: NAD(P)H-dependent oxidoreductase [Spirochaetia bacterium]|nr:NAD(P)H-dependent oxidoreductase [Spirochaetia bacterium]